MYEWNEWLHHFLIYTNHLYKINFSTFMHAAIIILFEQTRSSSITQVHMYYMYNIVNIRTCMCSRHLSGSLPSLCMFVYCTSTCTHVHVCVARQVTGQRWVPLDLRPQQNLSITDIGSRYSASNLQDTRVGMCLLQVLEMHAMLCLCLCWFSQVYPHM